MGIACVCDRSRGASSRTTAILIIVENISASEHDYTGTSLPCSWLPPSQQAVTYSELAGIELIIAKLKRKEATQMIAFYPSPPKNEHPHQMKQTFS